MHVSANQRAIDCDVHPTVPDIKALLPYLDEYLARPVEERGIAVARNPRAIRPRRRSARGRIGARRAALPRPSVDSCAIRCSTAGRRASRSATASTACNSRSTRTWRRRSRARSTTGSRKNGSTAIRGCAPRSWCRCRTSNMRSTRSSAAPRTGASCRCSCSPCARCRSGAGISGRSMRAAERHGLPIGIHAGSAFRHPVTSLGWPSYYLEDYASQSQGFQSQLASLICEGVFAKFPEAEGGADRIRRHLAARLPVAVLEILARAAHRNSLGRPPAGRDRARPCAPHHPAAGRPDDAERWNARSSICVPTISCCMPRISALAVRRR